jgi:hypothetical protein
MEWLLLIKLLCAHLLSDFVLQPKSWVESRTMHKIGSRALYYHIGVTIIIAALATLTTEAFATGNYDWIPVLIIGISHFFIDLGKSYLPYQETNKGAYFFLDQALHLFVIIGIGIWHPNNQLEHLICQIIKLNEPRIWLQVTAFIFLTKPAGIIIGILMESWTKQVNDQKQDASQEESLNKAGMWIGILERVLIFCFVLNNQYEIIGWLLAAKSIIRFRDETAPKRTEYLLIGSLLSVGVAIILGVAVKALP